MLPAIVTILRIPVDYFLGREIELFSYTAIFLGMAAAGLIFGAPLVYTIVKNKEEKY